MNPREFDRTLADWLAEGPTQPPVEVVNRALRDARRMGQARTVGLPWTDLPAALPRRPMAMLTTALAFAVVVAVVTLGVLSFQPIIEPAGTPPVTGPSPAQTDQSSPADSPRPTTGPSTVPTVEPTATPQATQTPGSTPTPGPTFGLPTGLSWREVNSSGIPARSFVQSLIGLPNGYLAVGRSDPAGDETVYWTWFSEDAEQWTAARLSQAAPCPESAGQPDAAVNAIANDGSRVVLVGRLACGTDKSIAWVSTDGVTWQRSEPFGGDGASSVWPVPGGWEAIVGSKFDDTGSTLWASSDGLRWEQEQVLTDPGARAYAGAAGPDGSRLIAVADEVSGRTSLQASSDGTAWMTVQEDVGDVTVMVAPPAEAEPLPPGAAPLWLVGASEDEGMVWVSSNLVDWQRGLAFAPGYLEVARTRHGYLASGIDPCPSADPLCDPNDSTAFSQYLTGSGVEWLPFGQAFGTSKRNHYFADGPAAVIGVEFGSGGVAVWRLEL